MEGGGKGIPNDWFEWLGELEAAGRGSPDSFTLSSIVSRVITGLELKGGERVLEFGAGMGVLTFELARSVGPGGSVTAVEADPRCFESLRERCRREGVSNVIPVLGSAEDQLFPQSSYDSFACRSFLSYCRDMIEVARKIRAALKEGGTFSVFEPLLGEVRYVPARGQALPEEFIELDEALRSSGPPRSVDRWRVREALSLLDPSLDSLVVRYRFALDGLGEEDIVREYLYDLPGRLSALEVLSGLGWGEAEARRALRGLARAASGEGAAVVLPCIFARGRRS